MTRAQGPRLARDHRAALRPEPARVRGRGHRRRGQHQALPREAVVGRGLQRPRQHRHLRHRAEGARPHQGRTPTPTGRRTCFRPCCAATSRSTASSSTTTGRDIGSIQSYLQANWDALDGKVRCHIPGRREGNVWMGEGVEIGIGVQLDGPAFIGDEVKLKAGAILNEHVVIDKYSVIDDNTKISNSIVWPHSYIGERCRLRQAIVCRNVTIKNDSLLEENSVVADECVLGKGSQIRAGVKIWPSKTVEPGSTVNESIIWAGEWRQGLFSSYGLGGSHQRRADAGVLRAARRRVRRDAAEGRVRRGRPGPCALVANDQARDRVRHRQRRRQGSRRARAAGAGDAVRDARRRLCGRASTCSSRRSISAAPTSASSTPKGCRSTSATSASSRTCSSARTSGARRSTRWATSSTANRSPEYTAHLLQDA